MSSCPRCSNSNVTVLREGREGNELVWTLFGCPDCYFHWRDSEPAETIDPARRKEIFQVDTSREQEYAVVIPVSR
ncbi:MAG TPA: hypothetical protein DCF45_06230 [Gammaproteobacteria bacterium]|nr:hypothetical protein [Gammaproteobacteria bacterium]